MDLIKPATEEMIQDYLMDDDRGISVRVYWSHDKNCYIACTRNVDYEDTSLGRAVAGAIADEIEIQT